MRNEGTIKNVKSTYQVEGELGNIAKRNQSRDNTGQNMRQGQTI